MSIRYKIGYIDEDPNQVKLYKRKLRVYGFEVIGYEFHKGMTIEELMEQVSFFPVFILRSPEFQDFQTSGFGQNALQLFPCVLTEIPAASLALKVPFLEGKE